MATIVQAAKDPWWAPLAVNVLGGLWNDWQQREANKKANAFFGALGETVDTMSGGSQQSATTSQDTGQGLLSVPEQDNNGWAGAFHKTNNPLTQYDTSTAGVLDTAPATAKVTAPAVSTQATGLPTAADIYRAAMGLAGTKRFAMMNPETVQKIITPFITANEAARQEQIRNALAQDYTNATDSAGRKNVAASAFLRQLVDNAGFGSLMNANTVTPTNLDLGGSVLPGTFDAWTGQTSYGNPLTKSLTPQQAADNAYRDMAFAEDVKRNNRDFTENNSHWWTTRGDSRIDADRNYGLQVRQQEHTENAVNHIQVMPDGHVYGITPKGGTVQLSKVPGMTETEKVTLQDWTTKSAALETLRKEAVRQYEKAQKDYGDNSPEAEAIRQRISDIDNETARINSDRNQLLERINGRLLPSGQSSSQSATNTQGGKPKFQLGATMSIASNVVSNANNGRIRSAFGIRNGKMHNGVDIAVPEGHHILVPDTGTPLTVKSVGTNPHHSFGNHVRLEGTMTDSEGNKHTIELIFAHMKNGSINLSRGQQVNAGELIGLVGNTGNTTDRSKPDKNGNPTVTNWYKGKNSGYHLHMETKIDGKHVDPEKFQSLISPYLPYTKSHSANTFIGTTLNPSATVTGREQGATVTQDSSDDGSHSVGTFIFSAGIGSNARDYSFNVVSSHAGLSHGRELAERYHSKAYADRLTRWNGPTLEIRTKRGKLVATYTPYLGGFYFSPDFDSKHSPRWKAKFQRDFMANSRNYLNAGGFLDIDGNLKPDGNEAFRERWRARRAADGIFGSFSSNELQQEDIDAPNVGTLSVSYQNSEGREVNADLSVEIGTFGDDLPAQQRYYGRHLNIRDKYGRLIARYSPRTNTIKFTKNSDAQAMQKSVLEQLKHKKKSILNNAGFLDENGKLIPDGNEGYRERRKAANDIPSSIPAQTAQDTQGISSVTPTGQQETAQNIQQYTQLAPSVTPMGQQDTASQPAPQSQTEAQAQGKPKGRRAKLANAIGNVGSRIDAALGSETYHQEAAQEDGQSWLGRVLDYVTDLLGRNSNTADSTTTDSSNPETTAGTPSNNRSSRITYQDRNGSTHTLTITSGEFDDSHPNEKQYFGKYIEYTDKDGHVVARYSPYVNFLQMAEGIDDTDSARDAIVQDMRQAGLQRLMQFGLADEAGLLVDDGNEDFRHKHRTRLDTNPEGITIHKDNFKKSTGQRVDNRTFWQKVNDNRKERKAFREVRDKIYQKLINAYSEASERNPDIITSKRLRQNYRTNSKAVAHIAASSIRGFAHAYGMSINDYFNNAMHLDVIFNPNEKGTNGFMRFIQPGEITEDGVRHETAEMVLNVTKFANESTAIHEFLHSFRREMENLITTVNDLPQGFYDDFAAMNRWLGISDIDFSTPYKSWTKEQQVRYKNAQEKWASAGEQYFATGKSPTIWLKHIFNKFKVWMANVYGAVKNIRYAGEDGHTHEVEITPETRKFFDNLLKDVPYVPSEAGRQARLALAKDTSRSSQGEGFYNQTASGNDYSRDTNETKELHLNLPFSPDSLRTESGNTIDEAKSSELLLTPEGSAALSYIDAHTAEAAGIQAGEIQANVGVLRHAENHHGKQIRQAGYKDTKTFLLDTLHNWKDIREGSNNSLWLVAPKDDGHGAVAAVRLHQDKNGIYRVSTLLFARNKVIDKKGLLFTGRPSPASSSGSGMNLTRASSASPGTSAAKGGLSLEQSLNAKSQVITSGNDPTPEVRFTHALSTDSVQSGSSSVNSSNTAPSHIGLCIVRVLCSGREAVN
ncbi:MAG: peptidoglycan DD-metalloendopeptidase family protein [Synergistaceae bacterium]|nr:peptidoglycan DD-metalloendopeptidase family protein [Synergistaceae bacterium]